MFNEPNTTIFGEIEGPGDVNPDTDVSLLNEWMSRDAPGPRTPHTPASEWPAPDTAAPPGDARGENPAED